MVTERKKKNSLNRLAKVDLVEAHCLHFLHSLCSKQQVWRYEFVDHNY